MCAKYMQSLLQPSDESCFFFLFLNSKQLSIGWKQLSAGSSHAIVRPDPNFLFVAMVIDAKNLHLNILTGLLGKGRRATHSVEHNRAFT